jgi:hypothetical protein
VDSDVVDDSPWIIVRGGARRGFEVYDIANNNITNAAFPGNIAFLPRSARWNEEMDERSARRSQETGRHDGPTRSFH